MKRKTKKRAQSVLGLTLIDGQLRAYHVTRTKGGPEVVKAVSAALKLDLLHPEAELVGRELKNHLDEAGVRERHCVVGIPPRWLMTQHTKVPDLGVEDTASYLQIEAEKGFPVDLAQLQIARSFQRSTAGEFVTQLAVRKEQLDQLGEVLKAAGLKPVSFSLGLAVLPQAIPAAGSGGRITVAVEPAGVTFLIAAGGGVAAFRTSEASIDSEAGEKIVNGASIARELRITFEQLPAELRAEVRELFLTGETTMVRQLADVLGDWAKAAGLAITRGDLPEKNLAAEMAERLAVNWLERGTPDLEFLPPYPGRWALLMARYNSKRLATAGFAVAALVLIVVGAFGWHEFRRWSLQSEWNEMQAQVTQLDAVQARIREFAPWYDTSFRNLSIMKRVTECFPDNGSVTAKSFEVHGNAIVTISGTARDNASLLRVQEQLRKAKEVQGLKIEQIRSKNPMQFTLTFRWNAST
ncbi:hypothetical protein [Horticoccus sp. 23ND18S-11]|uniref:hypothetical protein n=1 Tax=Horticoccus sp. 23ND18S-11 TaxID=3391832 RepID=UPI0039C8F1B1